MSRKKKAPKQIFLTDSKYKSNLVLKLMNSLMYDGKKTIAERIVYDAFDKLKSQSKEEPIKIFNDAITILNRQLRLDQGELVGLPIKFLLK